MNVVYSVSELSEWLDLDAIAIRDGLFSCGVPLVHNGAVADTSQWRPDVIHDGDTIHIMQGVRLEPDPHEVFVASKNLPEDWKSRIEEKLVKRRALPATHWPWGTHSTELLEHLAAAAKRYWKNYDPEDPTTAATNDEISNWLVSRGVKERTAEVMARILRADDLPAGRRPSKIARN